MADVKPSLCRESNAPGAAGGMDYTARSSAIFTLAGRSCTARQGLRWYVSRYNMWRAKMGAGGRPQTQALRSCPRYLADVFRAKARAARVRYERWYERTYAKWRCIHEHEGAWNSDTGNGYWGGLQMDWGFMHTYGPEFIRRFGLAHRWPVWAQLIAAERAFHGFAGFGGRGYAPWGTRGMCGV